MYLKYLKCFLKKSHKNQKQKYLTAESNYVYNRETDVNIGQFMTF